MDTATETTTNDTQPRRKGRAQQTQIPGTERTVIRAIEEAAEEYRAARDERMELTKVEVAKRAALLDVMAKHETTLYVFLDSENEEITVEIKTKSKVKVRKAGSKSSDDDEDA
jgi:hypothetical protein